MDSPEPIKPRKRRWSWRQYSISTMLIVVTMASVGLAVVANRVQRQRRAVAAIRELGGTVTYDFERKTPDDLPGPDWLCRTVGVDYFADVVHVRASGMTDATWSHLSALRALQYLDLFGTEVTDAGLAHPAGLTNLQVLWLAGPRVTDAGLKHLTGLTSLQSLWLNDTQVTDAGLAYLAGLKSLQHLYLVGGTRVTDAGLAHLAGLTNLVELELGGTQVTDEGCDKLQQALPRCRIYR